MCSVSHVVAKCFRDSLVERLRSDSWLVMGRTSGSLNRKRITVENTSRVRAVLLSEQGSIVGATDIFYACLRLDEPTDLLLLVGENRCLAPPSASYNVGRACHGSVVDPRA